MSMLTRLFSQQISRSRCRAGNGRKTTNSRRLYGERLEDRRVLATIVWDGGGDGATWGQALNWDLDRLPAAADDVSIPSVTGTTEVTYASGSTVIRDLESEVPIDISGGTLWVTGTGSLVAGLELSGGRLRSDGTVVTQGTSRWTAGSIFFGSWTNEGTLTIAGNVGVNHATLTNQGTVIHRSGEVEFRNGTINNEGIYEIQGGAYNSRRQNTGTFNNSSTLTTSTTVEFRSGVSFHQIGSSIDGNLDLLGGGSFSGSFTVAGIVNLGPGTTFPDREFFLNDGANGSGTGQLKVKDTLTVREGAATLTDILHIAGNVELDGSLTTYGNTDWTGGRITTDTEHFWTNAGTLNIGTLDEEGEEVKVELTGTLTNQGTVIHRSGEVEFRNGTINNERIYEIQGGAYSRDSFKTGTFNNSGTLTKSLNTIVEFRSDVAFENSGTVELLDGVVTFSSYTQTQGETILNGGDVSAPVLDIDGGSLIGSGTVTGFVSNDGNVNPGLPTDPVGTIRVEGRYTQGAGGKLTFDIDGSRHTDLLDVVGSVELAGDLEINVLSPALEPGELTIIENDATDSVSGIFDGLPEGLEIEVTHAGGPSQFEISYVGGTDDNDVVLRNVSAPPANQPPGLPQDIDPAANEVSEGAAPGTAVSLTAFAEDPDGDNVTYSLTDDAGGRFTIDMQTGVVTVGQTTPVDEDGPQLITVEASDEQGGISSQDFLIQVTNVAPTLVLDPVMAIDENGVATLTGTIIDPGVLDSFTLDVDWGDPLSPGNIEQLTFGASSTGSQTFTLTHQYLDDNPTATSGDNYTISATVTDDDGGSGSDSTTVLVKNVDPVIDEVSVPGLGTLDNKALPGQEITLTGLFSNIGTLDTHTVIVDWGEIVTPGEPADTSDSSNPLDGSIVCDCDGGGTGSFTATHSYSTGGIFTITVTVIDDDGGAVSDTTTVAVTGVGLVNGTLYVVGTDGEDQVQVSRDGEKLKVQADFNSGQLVEEEFIQRSKVNRIVMFLCGADDQAQIGSDVEKPSEIHGGEGNDQIQGGGGPNVIFGEQGDDQLQGSEGNDVLVGGAGNDQIQGGDGRDILIAGGGENSLDGGNDQDVLIGGYTSYDADVKTLDLIMAEWTSSNDYSTRVNNIRIGFLQPGTTVFGNGSTDDLQGSSDRDWFFAELSDDEIDAESDELIVPLLPV